MGKKHFDKNIKNKLEELDIKYDDSAWDAFEKKLDQAISEDHAENMEFDKQIKAKVKEDIHQPYEEKHWQELSSRIDYENELTNRIYFLKIVELAILVLLAYSFFQIEPIKKAEKNLPLYAHSEIFKAIKSKIVNESILENAATQDNLRNELVNPTYITPPSSPPIESTSASPLFAGTSSAYNFEDETQLVPVVVDDRMVEAVALTDHSFDALESNSMKASRETVDVATLDTDIPNREIIIPSFLSRPVTEKWVSLSASGDVNLVNTPTSLLINARDQLLNTLGFSTHFGYGLKVGKNEFEMGLSYSYINYDPDIREVFDVDGNSIYSSSLNRIAFHVAKIPFSYKRYLVDNRNWAAYASAGFSTNFIMFTEYDIDEGLIIGEQSLTSDLIKNSQLLRRDFTTGLFQNVNQQSTFKRSSTDDDFRSEGDLFDNSFLTSFVGLGVQRNFGERRALFLQTGYSRQFFGDKLGPNNDQINTFSFAVGGKFRI